jgi:CarD family transcriptional regulator
MAAAKEGLSLNSFNIGDKVVYPSHGVGVITAEETQDVAGITVSCYVITFDKDKMTLRIPKNRAEKAGLRPLSSENDINQALIVIKGKAKIERGMWSKRAQKYEAKIYSGDVVQIAEVVRDLHRNVENPNCSYSERQIYEAAYKRFINELAASQAIDLSEAEKQIKILLEEAKIIESVAA